MKTLHQIIEEKRGQQTSVPMLKWQRARIIKAGRQPQIVGKLIWALMGSRERTNTTDVFSGAYYQPLDVISINLVSSLGLTVVEAESLELLARDENDFAAEVPMMTVEEFLAAKAECDCSGCNCGMECKPDCASRGGSHDESQD